MDVALCLDVSWLTECRPDSVCCDPLGRGTTWVTLMTALTGSTSDMSTVSLGPFFSILGVKLSLSPV